MILFIVNSGHQIWWVLTLFLSFNKNWCLRLLPATIYSATTFQEKCRKVVLEKWFCKLRFFFWSTPFLEPDKKVVYSIIHLVFWSTTFLEPLFWNQISRTKFLEPDFYKLQKSSAQNKWSTGK